MRILIVLAIASDLALTENSSGAHPIVQYYVGGGCRRLVDSKYYDFGPLFKD